ncbi:MAG: 2OG-Fe(II) oxygenase [Pseudomonadota bacterium]
MPSTSYQSLSDRLERRDPHAAAAMLALAETGDADAQYKASELTLRGQAGPVDLTIAHRWMARAADKGHTEARRALAYYTAAGLGCLADADHARRQLEALALTDRFVAVQLALLAHVGGADRLARAERRLLSKDPHVEVVAGLFNAAECRYLQLLADPWLEPAMMYSTTGEGVRDPHRDSDNMVITPMAEDLIVQSVNRTIAAASGTEFFWGEPLHILRYRPGQQYRPHHDAHAFAPVERRRFATALLYLNDTYEGGETNFPELGITVRGQVGDLLIFHNLDAEGMPDPRMIHAGLPVTSGEKWLATRWIRGSDYFGRSNDPSP